MQFKPRKLRPIAEMVVGNAKFFTYRSSFYITQFFEECELGFAHDGSSRVPWAEDVLKTLLDDPQPGTNQLPERLAVVLRTLMDTPNDPFGILICPSCGSDDFKRGSNVDGRDNQWCMIECKECGWDETLSAVRILREYRLGQCDCISDGHRRGPVRLQNFRLIAADFGCFPVDGVFQK